MMRVTSARVSARPRTGAACASADARLLPRLRAFNVLFHLGRRGLAHPDRQLWFPAIGFGDTAAASGAVATCIALAAWERNYAPSERVSICSTSAPAADGGNHKPRHFCTLVVRARCHGAVRRSIRLEQLSCDGRVERI